MLAHRFLGLSMLALRKTQWTGNKQEGLGRFLHKYETNLCTCALTRSRQVVADRNSFHPQGSIRQLTVVGRVKCFHYLTRSVAHSLLILSGLLFISLFHVLII